MPVAPVRPSNVLGIIGVTLGGIGMLLSVIPCFGFYAFIFAAPGLVCSIFDLLKARAQGRNIALGVVGISLSAVALLLTFIWWFQIQRLKGGLLDLVP